MTALIVLGIVLGSIAAYGLIGYAFYRPIRYIRWFDYERANRGGLRQYQFSHGREREDEVWPAFIAGLLWPLIGAVSLVYHLTLVDWDAEQRRLVRELTRIRGPKVNEKLREALETERRQKIERMQKEIDRLEKEST